MAIYIFSKFDTNLNKKPPLINYVKTFRISVAASLGDMCEDRVQCYMRIENSGCQNFKCVCQQHMHEYNGKCYKNAGKQDNVLYLFVTAIVLSSNKLICLKNIFETIAILKIK